MKKYIAVLPLIIASCTSINHNVDHLEAIDHSNKTILVDSGNTGLNGSVKSGLRASGWDLRTILSSNTRYTLELRSVNMDTCIKLSSPNEPLYNYKASIIDNKTGKEVLSLNGRNCQTEATAEIVKSVNEK